MKIKNKIKKRGYTLVELIIAVGLFAIVMMLVSGAYIVMINLTNRAQGSATGIYNLSFALETMTRTIRTGSNYSCNNSGDCVNGTTFSITNTDGMNVNYALSDGVITQNSVPLTDPSISVSSLNFNVSGTASSDNEQPHVNIKVLGTVLSERGKTESFTVETGATMRTPDL